MLSSREKLTPIPSGTSTTPGGSIQNNPENKSQKDFFNSTLQSELNLTNKSLTSQSQTKISSKSPKKKLNDEKTAETINVKEKKRR